MGKRSRLSRFGFLYFGDAPSRPWVRRTEVSGVLTDLLRSFIPLHNVSSVFSPVRDLPLFTETEFQELSVILFLSTRNTTHRGFRSWYGPLPTLVFCLKPNHVLCRKIVRLSRVRPYLLGIPLHHSRGRDLCTFVSELREVVMKTSFQSRPWRRQRTWDSKVPRDPPRLTEPAPWDYPYPFQLGPLSSTDYLLETWDGRGKGREGLGGPKSKRREDRFDDRPPPLPSPPRGWGGRTTYRCSIGRLGISFRGSRRRPTYVVKRSRLMSRPSSRPPFFVFLDFCFSRFYLARTPSSVGTGVGSRPSRRSGRVRVSRGRWTSPDTTPLPPLSDPWNPVRSEKTTVP